MKKKKFLREGVGGLGVTDRKKKKKNGRKRGPLTRKKQRGRLAERKDYTIRRTVRVTMP